MTPTHTSQSGLFSIVKQEEDGSIVQFAMSPQQKIMLTAFLSSISKETPLVKMSEKYNLVLKSTVKKFK